MRRKLSAVFFIALLVTLGLALGLAGTYTPTPPSSGLGGENLDSAWAPEPPVIVHGWIGAGRTDTTPAFEVSNCPTVDELYRLGPGKDAVPALMQPQFMTAEEAVWLSDDAPVLGLKIGGESRCYPLAILNWHSLVHDRIAGQAIYVFWDPPSGLALARRVWAAERPLGLAGLGRRGVGLAYERANGALWDLFHGIPISYPGKPPGFQPKLPSDHKWLPLERMTWAAWRRLHLDTQVLSRDTGYLADYDTDPYAAAAIGPQGQAEDYWTSQTMLAPDNLRDTTGALPDKDWVIGFLAGTEPWTISLRELAQSGQHELPINTPAGPFVVRVWPAEDRVVVETPTGQRPPQVRLFWFAWKANFPEVHLWHPGMATDASEEEPATPISP